MMDSISNIQSIKPVDEVAIGRKTELEPAAARGASLQAEPRQLGGEGIRVQSHVDTWHQTCRSQKSRKLLEKANRYALAAGPVLILGECGTGTVQLANYIHASSRGSSNPIVKLACGKLANFSAECDNNEPAWFAQFRTQGCDPRATWLLEGVGEIPSLLQPAVSGLLDEFVGANQSASHPLILATSNSNIIEALEEGRFRHDLFYKLNVLELNIPSLRERKEDIAPLVEHFLSAVHFGEKSPKQFTDDAIAILSEYHWPGNIVELRNVVSQISVLCERSVVDAEQLLKHWQIPKRGFRRDLSGLNLEDAETFLILEAVARCEGNKTAAAKQLGITPRTLQNKMLKYRKLGFVK